jgi:septal ring factor EnvC (AmiA/AmiB activator)
MTNKLMMYIKKIWFFGMFLYISLGYAASSIEKELKDQKKALQELQQSLRDEQRALEELVQNKADAIKQANQTEENIRITQQYLAELEQTSRVLLQSLSEKKMLLQESLEKMKKREAWMANRAKVLYITQKKQSPLTYFFAEGQSTWSKRLFFTRRMIAYDRDMLELVAQDKKQYQESVQQLENKNEEVTAFQEQRSQEAEKYQGELVDMQVKINTLQSDEEAKRKALEESKKNAKALARIIKKLEERRRRALAVEGPKVLDKNGNFCEPVQGDIVSNYGVQYHQKLKTSTKNLGIEYLGQGGASVVSATAGEVVYVNQIPGYGKGLILYHGSGFYSIYGNLQDIQVQEEDNVVGCETLSTIPTNRGKASRRVYFEVRKERDSIHPVKWLKTMIN